jgi:ribosomal protein S18 acetylase RimI-like enzyme
MKEREMNSPDIEPKQETVETRLLSEGDIDRMVELENRTFDEVLRATKETITERLRLGHHIIGAYDGEELVGMISFSYSNADPNGFIDVPMTAVEFSRQPMAKEPNAAFVYNLSVLPEYRGRNITQELARAMTKQAKQDQCLFIVGEGRIPSYNGSDSKLMASYKRNEEVHEEIERALREKKMPSEEAFLKDPLLEYYKKIFDDLGLTMTFVRLIPDFSPADTASGGLRVLFKVELR